MGYHFLLQGISLTQGLNPGVLHCRQILYHSATREAHEMGYLEIKGYSQELDLFVEENTRFMIFKECPDTSLTYGSLKYFITIAHLYLFFIFYFLNFKIFNSYMRSQT